MNFIDTHAHVHFDKYGDDAEAMLKRAHDAGVSKVITVGVSIEDSKKAIKFAEKHPNVWASIGAHPHDGAGFMDDVINSIAELNNMINHPKVVAVGEIGLDYYHNYAEKTLQKSALLTQLEFAKQVNKPVIFHIRDAWDDFWPIFDEFEPIAGVVHSFSANYQQLNECLKRNLYVALNGIMTFTKDEVQLKAAKEVPNKRLLLETDAPFLTPAPFRGKICEVKHVVNTAEFLATLRQQSLEELSAYTTNNAQELFGLTD